MICIHQTKIQSFVAWCSHQVCQKMGTVRSLFSCSAHPPPVDRHITGKAVLRGRGDLGQLGADALREDPFQRLFVQVGAAHVNFERDALPGVDRDRPGCALLRALCRCPPGAGNRDRLRFCRPAETLP